MLITAKEIIVNSWETYSKNWKKLLPYMGLLFASSLTLGIIGIIGLKIEQYLFKGGLVFANNLLVAALVVALLLFTLWITIAMTKNLRQLVEKNEELNIKENFSQTGKYLWPVIWVSFLMLLTVIGGFILFMVPALIFAVWFAYYFYTVIFEEKNGIAALKSSRNLVMGRWWRTLWLLIAPGLFYGVIIMALQGAITMPLQIFWEKNSLFYIFSNSFINTTISALFAPLTALTTLYLYLSAKANPVEKTPETPAKV